jgi:hypothetical protein
MQQPQPTTTETTNLSRGSRADHPPLTNDNIVQLVKAGLTEEVITEKIQTSQQLFKLDTDSHHIDKNPIVMPSMRNEAVSPRLAREPLQNAAAVM